MVQSLAFGYRRIYACVGMLVGFSGALTFGGHWNAWGVVTFGCIQFVLALIAYIEATMRHKAHRNNVDAKDHITPLRTLGIAAFIGCLAAMIAEIARAIVEHQKLDPTSDYLVAVWAFLATKWGFILWYHAETYARYDKERKGDQGRPLLLNRTESDGSMRSGTGKSVREARPSYSGLPIV